MNKDAFIPSMEGIRGTCDLSDNKGFGPPPQSDGSYAVRNHGLFWLFVAGSLVLVNSDGTFYLKLYLIENHFMGFIC